MKPYKAYVEEGFETLLPPLEYFVETELSGRFGRDGWMNHVADGSDIWKECRGDVEKFRKSLDIAACLKTIRNEWQSVFCNEMAHGNRAYVEELLGWRNKLAHAGQDPWEWEDAYRALDTMFRFAVSMESQTCADKIKALRDEILVSNNGSCEKAHGSDDSGGDAFPSDGGSDEKASRRKEGKDTNNMKSRHTFNFPGGGELTTMGAVWFVSYMYHEKIDDGHLNWKRVSTFENRKSVCKRTTGYHRSFMEEILKMNDSNLEKNTIGLSAKDVKRMARELLDCHLV